MSFKTFHSIYNANSFNSIGFPNECVDLIVTSPPYPMVEMWDDIFSYFLNVDVKESIVKGDGWNIFEIIHNHLLNNTWGECARVLKPGGTMCINIGDATRRTGELFTVFPNAAKTTMLMGKFQMIPVPGIIWSKPSNSPNKFMGSGMMPTNAYITNEHEHILIFKKSHPLRQFNEDDKLRRRQSAYFYHERNSWFTDIWEIRGVSQKDKNGYRTGAFPVNIPYRLINMFSLYGDTVFDPFAGTGTTATAAAQAGRNSVMLEANPELASNMSSTIAVKIANTKNETCDVRLERMLQRKAERAGSKYQNLHLGTGVKTSQETDIVLVRPTSVDAQLHDITVGYDIIGKKETVHD